MKILHICQDEKFIDFFYQSIYQKPGVDNCFVVVLGSEHESCRFIKETPAYRLVGESYFTSDNLKQDLINTDVVLIHFLTNSAIKLIEAVPKDVKIVWSGWGADYYSLIKQHNNLLEEETTKIQKKLDSFFGLRALLGDIIRNWRLKKILHRVDYFSAPIPQDFQMLKDSYPNKFRAEYLQLNYASLEKTYLRGSVEIDKKAVLIGNSADKANNHVEAFYELFRPQYKDYKIIVPLSYGGNQSYRKYVIAIGKKLFGANFYPITEFLPLEDYNKIVGSCEIVIMNHIRQQAIGNIGCILANGAKLFLNRKSPLYAFLIDLGAIVYELKDLHSHVNDKFDFSNTSSRATINQNALKVFWGEDVVSNNIDNFILTMKAS